MSHSRTVPLATQVAKVIPGGQVGAMAADELCPTPADTPTTATTGCAMSDLTTNNETDNLKQQLQGKDELIAALVAELEQVVDQLDRVKRNGNDRTRTGSVSMGVPSEMLEEQHQLLGDLQRAVSQWEQSQPTTVLERIESELAEIRSMMSRGWQGSRLEGHVDSQSGNHLDEILSQVEPTEPTDPSLVTLSGSDWEAMKRQMLGESSVEDSEPNQPQDLTSLLDEITLPVPVDLDTATPDTLKRACSERDTYIVQITRWIRSHHGVTVPDNWADLVDVPDELRNRVEELAIRLEEQVRLAEVEMSLERARLSREKLLIQTERAAMEKSLKRLGIKSLDELEDISLNSAASSAGDRRWMRFLGVNRKS